MTEQDSTNIVPPFGYCECGCGQKTNIAPCSNRRYGHVKGEPVRFVRGHNRQGPSLVGKHFGRWRVADSVERKNKRGEIFWLCECACGTIRRVRDNELKNGNSPSCGCLSRERLPQLNTKHGMARSPEYTTWQAMRYRCENPNHTSYHLYGGRGITVCERWQDFANFYADMGPKPSPRHSIDRRDGNGHYTPENCHWATYKQQGRNTSRNRMLTFQGETLSLAEWAERMGISYAALTHRVMRAGWSVERALTTPVKQR